MKKPFTVFLILFVFQTIISCVYPQDDCGCPKVKVFDVAFENASIRMLERVSNSLVEITGPIASDHLVAELRLDFQSELAEGNSRRNFGFPFVSACTCAYYQFEFADPISSIEIFAHGDGGRTDLSQSFGLSDNYPEVIYQQELVEAFHTDEPFVILELDFNGSNPLVGNYIFEVQVTFQSGAVLSDTTEEITFI